MKRSKHNLSHYRLLTGAMGKLLPIGCTEVIPGDTIEHSISSVVRVTPLLAPVIHPVKVRIHHFFVPCRLLWDEWEQFIVGDGQTHFMPTVTSPNRNPSSTTPAQGSLQEKDLMHLLGVPVSTSGVQVNSMPLRAFNMIFNEYFRDQDLVPPRNEEQRDIPNVAWEKDYFTSARPWTQKGAEVSIPLGISAPVVSDGTGIPTFYQGSDNAGSIAVRTDGSKDVASQNIVTAPNSAFPMRWSVTNLKTDLTQASAVDVNDLRRAFALQRYQEARARYGSRYSEYLRYLGITPSDARLQRPEYLGGGTTRLNFSEVLQTSPASEADTNGVGDMYGHGIAGVRGNSYRKFFEEHGYVVSLMSVRPKTIYQNGCHRMWLKRSNEEYFQKELTQIGQQGILKNEVYLGAGQDTAIFGYQDRYREYKENPSLVQGEFRNVLNFWHLARNIPSTAALNASFVTCEPSDRIYQVQTNDPLWIMVNHKMIARRLVPSSNASKVL